MLSRTNLVTVSLALIGATGITVALCAGAPPVEEVTPAIETIAAVEVFDTPLPDPLPPVEPSYIEAAPEPVELVSPLPVETSPPVTVDLSGLPSEGSITLPPCEIEDATNCYWNSAVSGNGIGSSFLDVNGVTYYAAN